MPIINLRKTKLLWEPCINTFSRSKDITLSILISNNWCWTLKSISVMFLVNYIWKMPESLQCQKRHTNQDKEQRILPITIQKWNNPTLDLQEIPKWRLCPKDQAASIWLIQTVMLQGCKNSTPAQCMEVINSIQVFQATSTINQKPNTHPKVWGFLHKRWTRQERCQKFTTKAQFLNFNLAQTQRVISEIQLRKWIPEDSTRAEFRMTSSWLVQVLTRMMMVQNFSSLNLLMISLEINWSKSWREVSKLTYKECRKEKVSM